MPKRWTLEDDKFLFQFYEAIGSRVLASDLGRTPEAIDERMKKLKATEAWKAMSDMYKWEYVLLRKYYTAVGTHADVERLDAHHLGLEVIQGEMGLSSPSQAQPSPSKQEKM